MALNQSIQDLVQKYNTSGPRYTSYPTAPQWKDGFTALQYKEALQKLPLKQPIALYVHIPFCESLCYYCGCNIQITKDHSRSRTYLEALKKEMKMVAETLGEKRSLSQVSWGGGTPTFFSSDEMIELHTETLKYFSMAEGAEVSIEIDPRVTSNEQLDTLKKLGFNRVSLGVQDFDSKVQEAIHRVQSFEMTKNMLTYCRSLGFKGINFDLIYGLPFQTLASFVKTVELVCEIKPDRIALYNYAHLPTLRPHQKILEAFPMPEAETRLEIFTKAFEMFSGAGYCVVGMDHFALKTDELYQAIENNNLYRNFMGYTVKTGTALIGIGASSIGEIGEYYFQNIRETTKYENKISETGFATMRGCHLSEEDTERKWIIQKLMCSFNLSFEEYRKLFGKDFENVYSSELQNMKSHFVSEGVVEIGKQSIRVTELGRLFVRNIAMLYDGYLQLKNATYSKTV